MSSTDESTATKATVDGGESEGERVKKEGGEEGDVLMSIKLNRKLSGSEVMMRGEQDKVVGFNEMKQTSVRALGAATGWAPK